MITSQTAKKTYTIASGVTNYDIGFSYDKNPDTSPQLQVQTYKGTVLQNTLVYGTNYTLSANGLQIVLVSGYDVGDKLVIMRNIPQVQLSDYVIGRIDPEQIERDFDEAVMRDQQLQAEIDILGEMPADHETRIEAIESKIPAEATSSNQLADKAYVTSSISTTAATLQPKITNDAMLSADLVDDTSTTHKFVSASEKSTWNGKQDALDTAQMNAVNSGVTSTTVGQVATNITDIANRVVKNAAITAATKCKITYDSKGLVTGGANISTADLTNVNISSPSDGQVLMYDNDSGKWVNKTSTVSVAFDGITGQPRDNTALAAELNKYVTLAGSQTVSGTKTFSNTIKTKFSTQYPNCITHTSTQILNNYSTPASDTSFVTNALTANNGDFCAYEFMQKMTDGDTRAGFTVRNRANSSGPIRAANLSVSIDSNGVASSYAPPSDANNSMVTTVSKSKARNGYFKLGNGMIVQWGLVAVTGGSRSITFPTAFSGAASWKASITPTGSNTGTLYTVSINNQTTTGCEILSGGNTNNVWLMWVAIGY